MTGSIYKRYIRNDISRNPAVSLAIFLFVAASTLLISLAALLAINLSSAIDNLMEKAQTPHFMQMHSGPIDEERLERFSQENPGVSEFQIQSFLNVDGGKIFIDGQSLEESVQDYGFCVQNESFDYLLDMNGRIITVGRGDVYLPISFLKEGIAENGGRFQFGPRTFRVAGFLRDSQMNASLASSKRLLISPEDMSEIMDQGSVEYLIEFRLNSLKDLNSFEEEYAAGGFENNGPTITYPLFRLINALSDGLMIAVILLVSALIVTIALLCIRFSLLAQIEDDYREIGVMKALGLSLAEIKGISLAKYALLTSAAGCTGFLLSLLMRRSFLGNIRLLMGETDASGIDIILGFSAVLISLLIVLVYVNGILRRFRRISPSEAIRFERTGEDRGSAGFFKLSRRRALNVNLTMGIKDLISRRKIYVSLLSVLVLAVFILTVPMNLHSTISSSDFTRYMGVGRSDLRFDIQQTEEIAEKTALAAAAVKSDPEVARSVQLTTKVFPVIMDDGTEKSIKVELGDHLVFPLLFDQGRAPGGEDEIALSVINAEALGRGIGDVLTLRAGGNLRELTVCGIYSDFTNGGKTAKACFSDDSAPVMWSVISLTLKGRSGIDRKVEEYAERFPFAKVVSIEEFVNQTFGATQGSVKLAAVISVILALVVTLMITLLFVKMLVVKDRGSNGLLLALGFSRGDLQNQYLIRSLAILFIGFVIGLILSNTLGEHLAGLLISSLGITTFHFDINAITTYVISPAGFIAAVFLATLIGTGELKGLCISESIKE